MGVRSRYPTTQIATAVTQTLRALCMCAPVAAVVASPVALAQPSEPATLSAAIPAQPLAQALDAFSAQTGVQLAYLSGIVQNQISHATPAGLSVQDALRRLLQGTGLHFKYLTPNSVRILGAAPPRKRTTAEEQPNEIIVTANRRREALQDVPITIQVLTGDMLAQRNATTFDDLVSYLPGVVAHGVGPSQNNIYVRGLGTGEYFNQAAGSNGSFPNVAVYLDEQSAQLPGRNLDIYAADLDRIEVLEGPQGTLFGAGAQSGVLRYITNKPKINVTEAAVNAGYATTAHGDQSYALDAMINIPVISDKLSVRAVIYNERRGGYIDNIPATFARSATDRSIAYANAAGEVPANSVVINNASLVANNINPLTYEGIRVGVLYELNDDWNALVTQSYQSIEADGVFAEAAADSLGQPQPELTVQLYNPSYNKDRFENTAITLEGRVGSLQLLYAGAYLVRNIEQQQDYTNYARNGLYVDYYQCVNPGSTPATAQCFTPSETWRNVQRNTHLSQELRLSTPDNWRLRAVGGLFYENYRIHDQGDWFYLTALPYFNPIGPPTGYYTLNGKVVCTCGTGDTFHTGGVTSNNPNVRPLGDAFFNDITRGYQQKAAYASVDFEVIPHVLTLTAGTRYFNNNAAEVGSSVGSFGCQLINNPTAPNPCLNREFINLNAEGLDHTFSGFRSRANVSWKVNVDALLYYTWSQGFRSGGFNRGLGTLADSPLYPGPGFWQAQARAHGGWEPPSLFAPDVLINNELGWKTSWLDQRLQWNGDLYQEDWNHVQIDAFAPDSLGNGVVNGGNYRIRGAETSGTALVATGLTLEAGAAWNHSVLVKEAVLSWADGTPINFATLQTAGGDPLPNATGTLGSALAGAPAFQGNIRARYEVHFSDFTAFAQIGAVHQSQSLATTDRTTLDLQGRSIAYELPAFTTYDGAVGIGRGAWLTQIYGVNLTDERAQLYANYSLSYKAVTVNRPRTVGLRFGYKFRSD
jgi:iron complex outermembrane receptor protein